jgi:hypothetical protein
MPSSHVSLHKERDVGAAFDDLSWPPGDEDREQIVRVGIFD